jgi:hypothetical protein
MSYEASVSALDIDAYFDALAGGLADRRADGRHTDPENLRAVVMRQATQSVADNRHVATDEVTERNVWLTSLLLASYQQVGEVLGTEATLALLHDTLATPRRATNREYIKKRFDVDGDYPDRAFERIAANFVTRGRARFGAGFTYEQDVQTDTHSFINVTRCFFLDFFTASGAPELTTVLCLLDTLWADELVAGPYNVTFERPTIMSRGDDACRFQFTRIGTTPDPAQGAL